MVNAPASDLSLLDALAADLLARFDAAPDGLSRRTLLWLDPAGEFARLVPQLDTPLAAAQVSVLTCAQDDGMQWPVKLAILRRDAAEAAGEEAQRILVYLPGWERAALTPGPDGTPPALWSIYEQRYKGAIWGRGAWEPGAVPTPWSLLGWLRERGLRVADEAAAQSLVKGGGDSLLARYAERHRTSLVSEWPRPLRITDVRNDLSGDPRDTLRSLFLAPDREVATWGENRDLTLERLAAEYGFALSPETDADGDTLADTCAVQLALTEAWDAFGRVKEYPFASKLPRGAGQRARQIAFLREDIAPNTTLAPRYVARIARLEHDYPLADWAAGKPGQPVGLPHLARTRWARCLTAFNAAAANDDWPSARQFLTEHAEEIAAGAAHHAMASARENGDEDAPHWPVFAALHELCSVGAQAMDESEQIQGIALLVTAYTERWWHADALHLQIRRECASSLALHRVRRIADLAYFDTVQRVNERFSTTVEMGGSWPPPGFPPVTAIVPEVWGGDERRGVVICDSLRWDLAQAVRERLGTNASVRAVWSTLPSATPYGMTAMLPLPEGGAARQYAPTVAIRDGAGRNLATRDGRKALLEATYGVGGKAGVAFLDMEDVLQGAAIPRAGRVVVFDNNIDEQGHKGTEELPLLTAQLVGNVARTVTRLHEAGIGAVHVLTDHGFLLLAPGCVDDLGRPEVPIAQALTRSPRYAALKPDSPYTDIFTLPSPWPGDMVRLGFPRGVRTLEKADEYEHGGISLHECVIPALVSRRSPVAASLGVDLRVTTTTLTGGTVPAILVPVIPPGQVPLGGLAPLMVRLWVETADDGAAVREVTEVSEIEVRADTDELRPPIYLREGLDLRVGQHLTLRATDAATGRDLGRIPLDLIVDWE